MALGGTIGQSARLTQNNRGLYVPTGGFTHGIHVALMGDPTLRLHMVAPPSAVKRTVDGSKVRVTWQASADAGATYHVYSASEEKGPWTRVTEKPVAETSFTYTAGKSAFTLVRAVKLEAGGGGSYFNASQGILAP